jgi:hypothetical protein
MIKISDYIDIKKRAQELGCNIPTSITLIPRYFKEAKVKQELMHEDTAATVRILWRQNGITETPLEQLGEKFPCLGEKSFEWIAPTFFISASLLSNNQFLIQIALNVISDYLSDFFKGIPIHNRKVKLSIIVENRRGNYKNIDYEGTADGLKNLPKIIREIHDE